MKKLFLIAFICIVCALSVFAQNVPENLPYATNPTTVYVDYRSSDAESGNSDSSAKKTMISAIDFLEDGGTIVVSGKGYIPKDYSIDGTVLITSFDGEENYMDPQPITNPACAFKMASGKTLTVNGNLIFDDIIVFQENEQNSIIVENGATLVIGDGVVNMTKKEFQMKIVVNEGGRAIIGGGSFEIENNGGEVIEYSYDYDQRVKGGIDWTLENGVLTISGVGAMEDFYFGDRMAPWSGEKENVTKIVVEEGITSIGRYAFFSFSNVCEVSLPTTVLTIGNGAFWNCGSIQKIHIPKNVKVIVDQAFANCTKIVAYSVDAENEYFTAENGVLFNKDLSKLVYYAGGCGVENYTVPETVKEIGANAFTYCGVISSITLPEGLTNIGNGAFSTCFRLEKIVIPSSVTRIEDYAFEMCSSLASITFSDGLTYIGKEAFLNCTRLDNVTLPNTIKEIDSGAFNYCTGLTAVNIPKSLEIMDSNGFSACSKLTEFTVDSESEYFAADNGVLFDKEKTKLVAFPSGKEVKDYVVPESVTVIGESAFRGCENLVSINTSNVQQIEASAFSACTALEKAELSANVISIGDIAFFRCTALKDFTVYALDTKFALFPFEMCSDDLVISCYRGSTFEKLAKEHDIACIDMIADFESRDVDCDGSITVKDVLIVLEHLLNGEICPEVDVNDDGKVALIDVLRVLKAVAE